MGGGGPAREFEGGGDGAVEGKGGVGGRSSGGGGRREGSQRVTFRDGRGREGVRGGAILLEEVEAAVGEVAEVVGEVSVHGGAEARLAEVAVAAESHLFHEVESAGGSLGVWTMWLH